MREKRANAGIVHPLPNLSWVRRRALEEVRSPAGGATTSDGLNSNPLELFIFRFSALFSRSVNISETMFQDSSVSLPPNSQSAGGETATAPKPTSQWKIWSRGINEGVCIPHPLLF